MTSNPGNTNTRGPAWLRAERQYHMPMKDLLPGLVRMHGVEGAAYLIGVHRMTMSSWISQFGWRRVTILVGDDEEILVRPRTQGEEKWKGPEKVV